MKHLATLTGIAILCAFIGTMAPAYAQAEHHEDQAKPEQRAEKKQQAKQSKSAQHAQQKQEAQQSKSAQRSQRQDRSQRAGPAQQTERAGNNDRGGIIPDARFRAHFGRDHAFRINRPVMVSGAPRFQYGGYWFGFGEPWPVGWSYSDQVYVDYIDGGYYLLSPVHAGVQISINIVL